MLETLLFMFLLGSVSEIVLPPILLGGAALYLDIKDDIEAENAMKNNCVIYTKNYTNCNPEWRWGNYDKGINYQDLIGCSLEKIQSKIITTDLIKLEKDDVKPTSDYTLLLYFREDICIYAEYIRPINFYFFTKFGRKDENSFHVHSKEIGKKGEIDISFCYHYFSEQMVIEARLCADSFPRVISTYCRVHKENK